MRWDEASGENVDIEFHDSVVVALSTEGKTLAIRLSPAWVHRSAGKPGVDAGTVWTQEATLRLDEAVDVGERSEWPAWLVEGSILNPVEVESDGYIYDGRVEVDGRFLDNCVPARCDLSGKDCPHAPFRIFLPVDRSESITDRTHR